jgi:hypothetical protein
MDESGSRPLRAYRDVHRIRVNGGIAADVLRKDRCSACLRRRLHAHRGLAILDGDDRTAWLPGYACGHINRCSSCGRLGGQAIRCRRGRAHGERDGAWTDDDGGDVTQGNGSSGGGGGRTRGCRYGAGSGRNPGQQPASANRRYAGGGAGPTHSRPAATRATRQGNRVAIAVGSCRGQRRGEPLTHCRIRRVDRDGGDGGVHEKTSAAYG